MSNKSNNFTNFYKDEKDFIKNFKVFQKGILFYSKLTPGEVDNKENNEEFSSHCKIVSNYDFNEKIKQIVGYQNNNIDAWEQIIADKKVWELAFSKEFRIFGIFEQNIFTILIIDPFHLVCNNREEDIKKKKNNSFTIYE
jgi:hypothetical protein